jgi:hypothetical protein
MHGEGIQTYFHANAAEARFQVGDFGEAKRLMDLAMSLMKKTPPASYFSITTLVNGAQAWLGLHHRAGESSALDGAREMHRYLTKLAGMYPYMAPGRDRIGGEIALRTGKTGRATALFSRALAGAVELGMPVEEAESHAVLAVVGPAGERRAHAEAASALFARTAGVSWKKSLD